MFNARQRNTSSSPSYWLIYVFHLLNLGIFLNEFNWMWIQWIIKNRLTSLTFRLIILLSWSRFILDGNPSGHPYLHFKRLSIFSTTYFLKIFRVWYSFLFVFEWDFGVDGCDLWMSLCSWRTVLISIWIFLMAFYTWFFKTFWIMNNFYLLTIVFVFCVSWNIRVGDLFVILGEWNIIPIVEVYGFCFLTVW